MSEIKFGEKKHYERGNFNENWLLSKRQKITGQCSGTTWSDGVGREVAFRMGGFRMRGTHVYLWPIHVDVWQKPL